MPTLQRTSPLADFSTSVASTAAALRLNTETLFSSSKVSIPVAASREASELRDTLKSFQQLGVERAVLKLSFLWHESVADIFPHLVAESFAHAAVSAPALVDDISARARSVAIALASPCVAVDLICSRFARGKAPVHVDYGEFLLPGRPELDPSHVKALSFVMPYVGEGTEYLAHHRGLVENSLSEAIRIHNNSILGIGRDVEESAAVSRLQWLSTPSDSFTLHRNGLSIHRAPSSRDFRLLLAIDACVSPGALERPLDAVREKVLRNVRLIRGHRSALR